MKFQRSDVVLVPFPFSDLSTTKVRPAVVVSSALYHATEPDLLLVALTSRVATATGPFDYLLSDWRTAGLRYPSTSPWSSGPRTEGSGHRPSALKPVLFTLDPARVIYRIGALTPADLAQVDQRLRRALAL